VGRLFWKFFFFIWLAQLTTIVAVGTVFWLDHRDQDRRQVREMHNPPVSPALESAAATLQFGGTHALKSLLLSQTRMPVYAVDDADHELLGRDVAAGMLTQLRWMLSRDPATSAVRQAESPDGHTYILFQLRPEIAPGDHIPADGPRHGEPPLPVVPLVATLLASLIFAALLARYVSKPIRHLRSAFESVIGGNLAVRLDPVMGKRSDELADLGRNFDRMATHLGTLIDGQRRLMHDVSHELRSPLARLHAAIGLVRQQPERLETSLERIERESGRMDNLVGELLTLSRLEAGVMGAMDEDVRVGELIADVVADARFEAESSGHVVDLSGDVDVHVRGRAELLHRALENVVRNALRHTPRGGRVDVEVALYANGSNLRITVLDQGLGVPDHELDSIFEPFFRGEGAKYPDGHGLGLAIARQVIEAHGGLIRAANRLEGGLCVEIILPVMLVAVE
jgi:two-component system, OmpR family, sensor kinase